MYIHIHVRYTSICTHAYSTHGVPTHYNTLQHTSTHYNTLQHTKIGNAQMKTRCDIHVSEVSIVIVPNNTIV